MNPAFSSLLAALARELDLPGIETRDGDSSCLLGIDDFEVSLRCLSTDQVMIFLLEVKRKPCLCRNHTR